MAMHFDASIKDLIVCEAIASETTAATFYSGASAKEIQILKEDGSGVPTAKGKFFIVSKKADGTMVRSDVIDGTKIKNVTQKSAVTAIPGYSYFTVSTSGTAVGDTVETVLKTVNFSRADWTMKTIPYVITTNTAVAITKGLAKQIIRNLQEDYYMNNRPLFVHNNAGYAAVYTTEAVALADKASRTNGDLIWVIANGLPYTVADKAESTFAAFATLKTDWSSEITATTAEYVNRPAWYDVIIKNVSGTYTIYIIDRSLTRVTDKFDSLAAYTSVGAWFRDASDMDDITEWTVTRAGRVVNPTDSQQLLNLEYHLDKKQRQYGTYNYKEFPFTPSIVSGTTYYTMTIDYEEADIYNGLSRPISGNPEKSTIMIAFDASADSDTILGYINIARIGTVSELPTIALSDLSDVDASGATNGQQLTYNSTSSEWEPGAAS